MKIFLKGCYTILGQNHITDDQEKYQFEVPFEEKESVKINIYSEDGSLEAYQEVTVSEELYSILESNIIDGWRLPPKIKDELSEMKKDISDATTRTLSALKFFFYWEDMSESLCSSKATYWSKNGEDWKEVPSIITVVMELKRCLDLTQNTSTYIQHYLDGKGWEPFLALRHLHKAKQESNPRYKWIDATIAAELAIKEFYIQLTPQLETLLLEMPSPPLTKLYGSVMESFINERSPKLKEIGKGVEIRNRLVHRPEKVEIDFDKANKYVEDIEKAIYHLLSIIYGNEDTVIKFFREPEIELTR